MSEVVGAAPCEAGSAEDLLPVLRRILARVRLELAQCYPTSDWGSPNPTMWEMAGLAKRAIRCLAHLLHNAITEVLEKNADAAGIVRIAATLVGQLTVSPKRMVLFKAAQEMALRAHPDVSRLPTLIKDTDTRWSSTANMLESVTINTAPLMLLDGKSLPFHDLEKKAKFLDSLHNFQRNENLRNEMFELGKALQCCRVASTAVQDSSVTIAQFGSVIDTLLEGLDAYNGPVIIKTITAAIKKGIQDRYVGQYPEDIAAGELFDPETAYNRWKAAGYDWNNTNSSVALTWIQKELAPMYAAHVDNLVVPLGPQVEEMEDGPAKDACIKAAEATWRKEQKKEIKDSIKRRVVVEAPSRCINHVFILVTSVFSLPSTLSAVILLRC